LPLSQNREAFAADLEAYQARYSHTPPQERPLVNSGSQPERRYRMARDDSGPLAQPPRGIQHHYSLLAVLQVGQGRRPTVQDYRRRFTALTELSAGSAVEDERQQRRLVDQVLALFRAYLADVAAGAFQDYLTRIAADLFESYLAKATADLFQLYSCEESLEVGDVVALVPDTSDQVVKANEQNAPLVIGVVAEEMTGEQHYRVVSSGQARCKVVGDIKPGDLLVPSAKDGCAERGEAFLRPGALIGKALGVYESNGRTEPVTIDIIVTLG